MNPSVARKAPELRLASSWQDELPQDLEGERRVLGAMLTDPRAIASAARNGLTPATFYLDKHRKLAGLLFELRNEEAPLVAVSQKAKQRGETELLGGTEYLARLMENPEAERNLGPRVRVLLEHKQQREAIALGITLSSLARNPGEQPIGEVLAQHAREAADLARNTAGAADLVAAARRFENEEARPDEKPEPLLGDGLLCKGDLALIAGKPGLGKSRVALELAEALTRGSSWLGMQTGARPVRVGYIAAEFSRFRWWQRCVRLLGTKLETAPQEHDEMQDAYRALGLGSAQGFTAITSDMLGEPLDLLTVAGTMQLEELVRELKLDLVVLDPLSRLMGGREETNEVFGKLVQNLDRVRHRTRACLLLVHHERKGSTERGGRDPDALDAIRGGTMLTTATNTVLRLSKSTGGLLRLEVAKTNFAGTPPDLWLRVPEDGGRTVLEEAPEEKGEANRQKVLAWTKTRTGTVTAAMAAEDLKLSTRTCRDHLSALAKAGHLEERKGPRNHVSFNLRGGNENEEERSLLSSWEPQEPQGFIQ